VPSNPAQDAAALELDAHEYPDERGEILLEAATMWRRAGDDDRAEQLLRSLVEDGGEDGCFAQVELAALAIDRNDRAGADGWLDRLAKDPDLTAPPCQIAAELLAEHDDPTGALRWYDRFVARLEEDQLDALDGPTGWIGFAAMPLQARRELREQLGLPPDAADERVPTRPDNVRGALGATLADLQQEQAELRRENAALTATLRRSTVLVFPAAERERAARTWPGSDADSPDYFSAIERSLRKDAENGVGAAAVVTASVADLVAFAEAHGGSPTEEPTRQQYLLTVPEEQWTSWPPERNGRCWCGSGIKYKKCCGRPGI
jgi:uncharacterized protein YchJ